MPASNADTIAHLRRGLEEAFASRRPDAERRYEDAWNPRDDYVSGRFSFADAPWTEVRAELDGINGAEEFLLHFTDDNFLYFLAVFADAALELMAEGEGPYVLPHILDALVIRTDANPHWAALASAAERAWLGEFLAYLGGYDLEDDPDENEEMRERARSARAGLGC